jgi:D-alanine--poly(phosphoribitol) ligase subunit 2
MDNIQQTVKEAFRDVSGIDFKEIESSNNIFESGVDSFTFMQIILEVEQKLGIQFDPTEISFNQFKTINGMCEKIAEKLK